MSHLLVVYVGYSIGPAPSQVPVVQAPPTPVKRPPSPKPQFHVGMKLEAVDRRFPYYVCVATIMDKRGIVILLMIYC